MARSIKPVSRCDDEKEVITIPMVELPNPVFSSVLDDVQHLEGTLRFLERFVGSIYGHKTCVNGCDIFDEKVVMELVTMRESLSELHTVICDYHDVEMLTGDDSKREIAEDFHYVIKEIATKHKLNIPNLSQESVFLDMKNAEKNARETQEKQTVHVGDFDVNVSAFRPGVNYDDTPRKPMAGSYDC